MKIFAVFTSVMLALACGAAWAGVDSDGDGVADADDFCPDSTYNVAVDDNGCSIIFFVNDSSLYFHQGNTVPKPSVNEVLASSVESFRQVMQRYPGMRFMLTGYGDRVGQRSLGLRRSNFVRDFYIRNGLDGRRLGAVSSPYSEVVDCSGDRNERCRERNRRVVLSVQ